MAGLRHFCHQFYGHVPCINHLVLFQQILIMVGNRIEYVLDTGSFPYTLRQPFSHISTNINHGSNPK